jgi:hypothetical protein
MPSNVTENPVENHGMQSVSRLVEYLELLDEERLRALVELKRLRQLKRLQLIRNEAILTEEHGLTAPQVLRSCVRRKMNEILEEDLDAEIKNASAKT